MLSTPVPLSSIFNSFLIINFQNLIAVQNQKIVPATNKNVITKKSITVNRLKAIDSYIIIIINNTLFFKFETNAASYTHSHIHTHTHTLRQ